MTTYTLPRRDFLMQALLACGAPYLAGLNAAQTAAQLPPAAPQRAARIAGDYLGATSLDAARAIGEVFRRHLNLESGNDAIVTAAETTLHLIARAPTSTAAITALVQNVRRDFRADRYVQLEGWLLSRTELDLCLLLLYVPEGTA